MIPSRINPNLYVVLTDGNSWDGHQRTFSTHSVCGRFDVSAGNKGGRRQADVLSRTQLYICDYNAVLIPEAAVKQLPELKMVAALNYYSTETRSKIGTMASP